jgi:tetratricopeptide (TPR) repeat protein
MTDGAFPDRLSQLRTRWEADPTSRIFLQLAEEYRHLGRVQDALAVLDKGLREHPGYLSALVAKGRCHLELGEGEAARSVLERVVKQDATQMVANKLLVRAYLETGDPAKARERLDLYSLLNDSDPEIEELRRRIKTMERPDEAAPPGPMDDPFALDMPAPAPRPAPQPTEADIFDLGAGPRPSRGGDVFQLEEPAPAAPVASAAPEPEPEMEMEEAGADGDLFPGLASRESRRRYLEGLAAEGLFALGPPEPAPAPAAPPPPPPPPIEEPELEVEAAPEPEVLEVEDTSWLDEGAPPYAPISMEPEETPVFEEAAPPAPAAEDLWTEEAPAPAPAFDFAAAPAALPAEPPAPAATATLGELYLRQGHLAEAERIFREVLQREPANAAAHAGLERLTEIQERQEREARPLDARQLLAGFRPAPEDVGEAGARARKVHLLSRYLERLRQRSPRDVS